MKRFHVIWNYLWIIYWRMVKPYRYRCFIVVLFIKSLAPGRCSGNFQSLRWRHNEHDGVSNHQPIDCLLNCLFRRKSTKHQSSASLAFVRGIHRSPVTQRASNAEIVSIWWCHHDIIFTSVYEINIMKISRKNGFDVNAIGPTWW